MEERLQKIMSQYGYGSRRTSETLIRQGRVTVNGISASIGDKADPQYDEILVDGKPLQEKKERIYLMLNKPRGYVTTMCDEKGRPDVWQLVQDCGTRVYPVGRLDMYSEGLLLMTNDGKLAQRLMHPSGHTKKVYHVWVTGFRLAAMDRLTASVEINGKKTTPAKVHICWVKNEIALLEFQLYEGRNRQIRRICQSAGVDVTRLKRIQEGPIVLGALPTGAWRYLHHDEIHMLMQE